ncbi:MAG: hypothetical protein Q7R51_00880 [bacterium]|nr:hypothetical protein [bacterium]
MKKYPNSRPKVPPETETRLFILCRRRCALCFGLNFDFSEKKGQIAHLNHNRSDNRINNLAFLCLTHHDAYDSTPSQSKSITQGETLCFRKELYKAIVDNVVGNNKNSYKYKYFNRISYFIGREAIDDKAKFFLKKLDGDKRLTYQSISDVFKDDEVDLNRFEVINDYLFKIYRDFWFIQRRWRDIKERYFQGNISMTEAPDYLSDAKTKVVGLSDQTDDWEDIGYVEEYAPVQLECHVYDGPSGQGFTLFARIKIKGDIWQNQMHVGPETYRAKDNFQWLIVGNNTR